MKQHDHIQTYDHIIFCCKQANFLNWRTQTNRNGWIFEPKKLAEFFVTVAIYVLIQPLFY